MDIGVHIYTEQVIRTLSRSRMCIDLLYKKPVQKNCIIGRGSFFKGIAGLLIPRFIYSGLLLLPILKISQVVIDLFGNLDLQRAS